MKIYMDLPIYLQGIFCGAPKFTEHSYGHQMDANAKNQLKPWLKKECKSQDQNRWGLPIPILVASRYRVGLCHLLFNYSTSDAQCMVYLPTFTINHSQMQVNMPYIECLGT